jgi:hypothetical protein
MLKDSTVSHRTSADRGTDIQRCGQGCIDKTSLLMRIEGTEQKERSNHTDGEKRAPQRQVPSLSLPPITLPKVRLTYIIQPTRIQPRRIRRHPPLVHQITIIPPRIIKLILPRPENPAISLLVKPLLRNKPLLVKRRVGRVSPVKLAAGLIVDGETELLDDLGRVAI